VINRIVFSEGITAMKLGIIIETNDPEQAWNAVRFANTGLAQGHAVKIFLMSAGVEIVGIAGGKFDVSQQLHEFADRGGAILACGTCIKSRDQKETAMCPVSTMLDCLEMTTWADKVLTF
jgi:uncharacterized protein involved in oxidation of intracellular sulfur